MISTAGWRSNGKGQAMQSKGRDPITGRLSSRQTRLLRQVIAAAREGRLLDADGNRYTYIKPGDADMVQIVDISKAHLFYLNAREAAEVLRAITPRKDVRLAVSLEEYIVEPRT